MTGYAFSKLIPGGNPTILLENPSLAPGELPALAARLMSPLHVGAEQVGALFYDESAAAPGPRLEMMGGEFCVNAARAAAMRLAGLGLLSPLAGCDGVFGGFLSVSGADLPVAVLAAEGEVDLARALAARAYESPPAPGPRPGSDAARLHCAARVSLPPERASCTPAHKGIFLARLPGIDHLLVDAVRHPAPDVEGPAWRAESAALRRFCGLGDSPASGVVWFEPEGDAFRILPAVEVKATASEHLESACGSASLALALALRLGLVPGAEASGADGLAVIQPSGETLRVRFTESDASGDAGAWVAGPVTLAAVGSARL